MWGYQPHFRVSLEGLAEHALSAVGAVVAPRAFLIGLADDEDAHHGVCIEPEDKDFGQTDLDGVIAAADTLFAADLGKVVNSHPGYHAQVEAARLDEARRNALCVALAAASGGRDRTFFAGRSQPVGGYRVYPVVGVLTVTWERLPALSRDRVSDRELVHRSLQHAVVDRVLRAASRALASQIPPQSVGAETAPIVRAASESLVTGIALRAGEILGTGLHSALDAVAAQPYEGRGGAGSVVVSDPRRDRTVTRIGFQGPLPTRDARAFRKALEMTGPGLSLLCDGASLHGLGDVADGYDATAEDCFVASVVGRGAWELSHAGTPLLRVDGGAPSLPRERLSRADFQDTVERLFTDAPEDGPEVLWSAALACAGQAHGTMLVVHPDPSAEAARLAPQALAVAPTVLDGDALAAVTGIDGAVLVGPDGRCHAVGVILDGLATGTGDQSRGARYNSAIRYLHGNGRGALAIIVSEDGMINLMPRLPRRVLRSTVKAAVPRRRRPGGLHTPGEARGVARVLPRPGRLRRGERGTGTLERPPRRMDPHPLHAVLAGPGHERYVLARRDGDRDRPVGPAVGSTPG